MPPVEARLIDVVVAVTCKHGTVWVREHAVAGWFCKCRAKDIGDRATVAKACDPAGVLVHVRCARGHLAVTTPAGVETGCTVGCRLPMLEISELTYGRLVSRARHPAAPIDVDAELEDLDLDELMSHLPTPTLALGGTE